MGLVGRFLTGSKGPVRRMATGVVAVLLALAMSATPSAASGQFTISPGSGEPGTTVNVSGTGCWGLLSAGDQVRVRVTSDPLGLVPLEPLALLDASDSWAIIDVTDSGTWNGAISMEGPGILSLVGITDVWVTATCYKGGIGLLSPVYAPQRFRVTAASAPTTTTVPATTTTAGSGGSGTTTTTAPPAPTTTTDVDGAGPTTTVGSTGGSGEGSTGSGSSGSGSSGSGSGSDGSAGTGSDGDGSTGSGSSGNGSSGSGSSGNGSAGNGSAGNGSSGTGSAGTGSTGSGSAGSGSVGGDQSSGLSDGADGSSGDTAADTAADGEAVEGSAERNVENGDTDDEVALAVATAPASLSDLTMGESGDDGVGWLRWLLAAIALAIGIAAVVKRQAIARLIG